MESLTRQPTLRVKGDDFQEKGTSMNMTKGKNYGNADRH